MSILYIQDVEMTSATRMTSASQMPSTNKMTAVYGSGKQMSEIYIWGKVSGGDRGQRPEMPEISYITVIS